MDRMNLVDYLKTIPKPTPTETGEKEKLKIFLVTARKSSRIRPPADRLTLFAHFTLHFTSLISL